MSADLNARIQAIQAGGDASRQREAGKMLARERISLLLDAGSFVEVGAFAGTSGEELSPVVAGYGTIADRLVYLYAQDFTVKGGAISKKAAEKILRVMQLAAKTGSPILCLADSAGARIDQGVATLDAFSGILAQSARLSGVVPQIALVLGPCAGGSAVAAQMCDLIIQADVGAQFMAGPQVVSAKFGTQVDQKALGGIQAAAEAGAAHITCSSETDAIAYARKVVSLLPSNNAEDAPTFPLDDLNRMINADGSDARTLIAQLSDAGDWLELQPTYASNLTIALARMGGRPVGVVANNPAFDDGVLCPGACKKAVRFVRFCDAFNLPVVTLVNTPGAVVARAEYTFAVIQGFAQLAYAYAEATVPKVSVVVGDAIGIGYATMASRALGADIAYAWPQALISPMSAQAAVHLLERDALQGGKSEEELAEAYRDANGALEAAQEGLIDDIIAPAATRQMVIAALEATLGKREAPLPRKHDNMPV